MTMNSSSPIIAGVFPQEQQARQALQALRQAGFRRDQIGYATQAQGQQVDLLSDFQNLGLGRESASYYDQAFRAGQPVVSVRPDGREQEAHDILHQYGGYDYEHQSGIAQLGSAAQNPNIDPAAVQNPNMSQARVQNADLNPADTRNPDVDRARYQNADVDTAIVQNPGIDRGAVADERDEFYQPRRLQLREEQLNVNKERVQSGEVGLRKQVVTEQQTIDVPVTHEEVYIERRPVAEGRIDPNPIGEDEVIRIPVSEEQVNVSKNTVVTGEVAIGKRNVEETRRVTDTVRREEARVERQGNARLQGDEDVQGRDTLAQENRAAREDDQENRLS